MKVYQVRTPRFGGTSFDEVIKKARAAFYPIEKGTKRRPYIRSAFFDKEKIFFDYFWQHLNQKPRRERIKRLAYFACAIELIQKSRQAPVDKQNPNRRKEVLYRFAGLTKEQELFFVQIKKDVKTGQKFLMSVFPPE